MVEKTYDFSDEAYVQLVQLKKVFNVDTTARVIQKALALAIVGSRYLDCDGDLVIVDPRHYDTARVKIILR